MEINQAWTIIGALVNQANRRDAIEALINIRADVGEKNMQLQRLQLPETETETDTEDPEYPVKNWHAYVRAGRTRLGYWDWVRRCKKEGKYIVPKTLTFTK